MRSRSTIRGAVLAAVLAAPMVVARPALAADAAAEAKAARVEAEKRLEEGLQRYARGDYEGARVAFAQAYAVLSSIDLLYNLSRAEVKSGHALEALVHVRQILRDPAATSEDRAKASKLLDEANAATGHVSVEAPAGTEIVIDAVPSGECPFREPLDVAPGKHVVEARVNGDVKRIEITTTSGETVTARFEIAPGAAAPPAGPVESRAAPAPEREHEHPRSSTARTVVPIVLGGAAIVAAGIGVVFGLESQSHETDATNYRASHPAGFCFDRTSASCGEYQGLLDSQQQATNIERVAFVAGGVLAVGAVATWALWPRARHEEKGAWIAPVPGGFRAGVTF